MTLHAKPAAGERVVSLFFAVGGVAITLSLVGAIWAANYHRAESSALRVGLKQEVQTAPPVVVTAPSATAKRGGVPQNGVVGGVPHVEKWRMATMPPLAWNDVTLMLRTGLTDDEVIAACAGKQLTTMVGPEQAQVLRELGAGNRLIDYLQGRAVYNMPVSASPHVTSQPVRQVAASSARYVPIATPYPTVDDAARDRQIASLKQRIDSLDESIRVARSGWSWSGAARDAYIDGLDKARNDLRREKWLLEGR